MNINIDKTSDVPVYQQIRRQVKQMVVDKLLVAGMKIPSVRELSIKLGISRKTVHTAYEELAAENIIETRHGSGTFIIAHPEIVTGTNLRTREEMSSPISELPPMQWEPYDFRSDFFMVPQFERPEGIIRLSLASPDPALFPFSRIKQVATQMLWEPKQFFFDIGHAQGYEPLIEHLEKEMALAGAPMAEGENDIIITGGFQRALALVMDRLVKPGQKVAIESPTFVGILNLLIAKEIDYVSIPVDDEGMDTEYLAGVLKREDIRAVITIPTYHNPTGVTMSQQRREHLLQLAAHHRLPVIEDDWGRMLRYEGESPAPLKALDAGGYVIHIGTYSKCFMPGLRIGWITGPSRFALSLVYAKLGSEVSEGYFLQTLLYEFITRGYFAKHLRRSLKEYRKRRNAMCKALDSGLPDGCSYIKPQGGFNVWLKLPPHIMSIPLLHQAIKAGVEFLPSAFCTANRKDMPALRLSFCRTDVPDITLGIDRLCRVINDCIDNPGLLEEGARK